MQHFVHAAVARFRHLDAVIHNAGTACSALVQDMIDIMQQSAKTPISLAAPSMDHTICPHRYYIRTSAPVADALIERRDGNKYITRPLTRTEIHQFAEQATNIDPQAFFAGLEDSIV